MKSSKEERSRRASIQAIMNDDSISHLERRLSIQALMDGSRINDNGGRRNSLTFTSVTSAVKKAARKVLDKGKGTNGFAEREESENSRRLEESRPECSHYERNCTIIAPCCGAAFACRICHDESPVLPPKKENVEKAENDTEAKKEKSRIPPKPNSKFKRSSSLPIEISNVEVTHHDIDRFAISEIICRKCYTRQSSKTNNCIKCKIQFGEYYCETCNLWMSNTPLPYHCVGCGFCRVGGAKNYEHCYTCGICVDLLLYKDHKCKQDKYKTCCPVCQEDMFTSRSESHEMSCGHACHWKCFMDLMSHDTRCPVCKKTVESRERMQLAWKETAANIKKQPLPPEMVKVVDITCVDCGESDTELGWHVLGVQCRKCSSFNTGVDRIVMKGYQAVRFLQIANYDSGHNSS